MTGYVTGTNNQLLEDGTYRYTYDKEDNRIEKHIDNGNDILDAGDTSVTLYQWDHRNRLVKYTFQANYGTDYRILTYEYDTFDRRVSSHTFNVSTGLAARSTYWVWDGQQMALQFSDGDGAGAGAAVLDEKGCQEPFLSPERTTKNGTGLILGTFDAHRSINATTPSTAG